MIDPMKNFMRDGSQTKDKSLTWIKNKHGVVSAVPAYIANDLLKDKNRGFELSEPEFVPEEQLVPHDNRKNVDGQQRANTEATYNQISKIVNGTHAVIDAYAKDADISLAGCKTKKEKLEALEKAGVLY